MGTLHENVIYNNILALCAKHTPRVSFSKMCNDLGLSKSLGTKFKNDPKKTINSETAQKIADYFGVTVDQVLGKEQQKTPAPVKGEREYSDQALLDAFNRADEATKAAIRLLLKVE